MDQLNESVNKIGVALKCAVALVEQADISAAWPLTDEERSVRIYEALATRGFDAMEREDLFRLFRRWPGDEIPPKDSPADIDGHAARMIHHWRDILFSWLLDATYPKPHTLRPIPPEDLEWFLFISRVLRDLDAKCETRYFAEMAKRLPLIGWGREEYQRALRTLAADSEAEQESAKVKSSEDESRREVERPRVALKMEQRPLTAEEEIALYKAQKLNGE